MKKIIYISLMLALAIFVFTGCSSASADKIYGKDDKDIEVNAGETFTISLEENPSTGYAWTIDISDESIVKLEKDDYEPEPADKDIVGIGGLRILTFKGLKEGSATITLTYERGFEENSATETLVYNVKVK